MPEFKFTVSETRHYEMLYTVEAKNAEEAFDKASCGETVSEEERKFVCVMHRVVSDEVTDD